MTRRVSACGQQGGVETHADQGMANGRTPAACSTIATTQTKERETQVDIGGKDRSI